MSEVRNKKTVGYAIASLICGCLFIIPILGMIAGLVAIVLGIVALVEISRNKDTLQGGGLAITGIVLGFIACIVMPILLVFLIAVPRMTVQREMATMVTAANRDIDSVLATALDMYMVDTGTFPTTDEGLEALLTKPDSASRWHGPYIEKIPLDPWGTEYQYRCPGYHGGAYDLFSLGEDGEEGGYDDVTNWE